MEEKKKRSTKSAKFAGLLAGLGVYSIAFLALPILGVFIALVFGISVLGLGIFIIGSIVLLFLLGPLLAILTGRFINFRWESYTYNKKYILGIISSLPVLVVLLIFVMGNGENDDKGNGKSNSYKYGNIDILPKGYLEKDQIWEENGKENESLKDSEHFLNNKSDSINTLEEANK